MGLIRFAFLPVLVVLVFVWVNVVAGQEPEPVTIPAGIGTNVRFMPSTTPDTPHVATVRVGKTAKGKIWLRFDLYAEAEDGSLVAAIGAPRYALVRWPKKYQHDSNVDGAVLGSDFSTFSLVFGKGWAKAPEVPQEVLDMLAAPQ